MLAELKRKQEAREAAAAGRGKRKSGGRSSGDGERQLELELDDDHGGDLDDGPREKKNTSSSSLSTNLHVSNLDPQLVDEASLLARFGAFGPVASVKVMWPLSEEERARGSNAGFVAFMARGDAERALRALDGERFAGGRTLRVGWAGAVPLPARALNEGRGSEAGTAAAAATASAAAAAAPAAAAPPAPPALLLPTDAAALRAASDLRRPEQERAAAAERAKATAEAGGGAGAGAGGGAAAVVAAPPSADALRSFASSSPLSSACAAAPLLASLDDARARFLVDCVAAAVASDGLPLERALARGKLGRGSSDVDRLVFGFLGGAGGGGGEGKDGGEEEPRARARAHPWAPYYRWRLFSLAHGEGLDWWSTAP